MMMIDDYNNDDNNNNIFCNSVISVTPLYLVFGKTNLSLCPSFLSRKFISFNWCRHFNTLIPRELSNQIGLLTHCSPDAVLQ